MYMCLYMHPCLRVCVCMYVRYARKIQCLYECAYLYGCMYVCKYLLCMCACVAVPVAWMLVHVCMHVCMASCDFVLMMFCLFVLVAVESRECGECRRGCCGKWHGQCVYGDGIHRTRPQGTLQNVFVWFSWGRLRYQLGIIINIALSSLLCWCLV